MTGHSDHSVSGHVLLAGYRGACDRLDKGKWERLPEHAFTSLFEALNWAAAIDEHLGEHWREEGQPLRFSWRDRIPNAELMRGLRFARNSVHHKWALAVLLSHEVGHDVSSSTEPPYRWVWRVTDELPILDRPDPRGRAAHEKALSGRPVIVTLMELALVFDAAFMAGGLDR